MSNNSPSFPSMPGKKHIRTQLVELRRRHDQVIQLHVIGTSNEDIRKLLGVSHETVQTSLYSELGKERIRELRELAEIDTADIAVQIHLGATRSIKFLNDVVSGVGDGIGASKGLRYKSAVELLRMDGFTPITTSVSIRARGILGEDGVKALLNKGRGIRVYEGEPPALEEPIEADFTELIPEGP